jgi:hypothetical protein
MNNLIPSSCTRLAVWLTLIGSITLASAANQENLDWRFTNPQPHGNNIVNMEYSPALGLGIQVCERGRFYHSPDLVNWTLGASGTTQSLRSVAFLNNRIIITGEAGTVLWGDSVTNLQPGTITATLDWLEDVAVSSNLAVAVGDFGAIYTSADGISWFKQTVTFSDWLRAVTWAGGQWVTVGETGTIATSPDGTAWTKQTSGTTADLNNVNYLDGTFYVVGAAGVSLSSPDAVTWTAENLGATNDLFSIATAGGQTRLYVGEDAVWQTLNGNFWTNIVDVPNGPPAWTYYSVIGFTDSFVLAGRTGLQVEAVRTNGAGVFSWTTTYESPRQWLWDSVHNGIDYVTVGDSGSIRTSANGAEFTSEFVPDNATNTTLLGISGDTNLLVTVGDSGTILFSTNSMSEVVTTNGTVVETNLVSELGIAWSAANSPTAETLQAITLFNGEFHVGGNNGYLAKSANGRNWSAISPFTAKTLTGMASSPGGTAKIVAVGDDGTAYVSSDGVNYSPAAVTATTDWLYRVRYLNGNFVIVGQNGAIISSADNGQTWTAQTSGTTAWINDVIHVGDRYYAVGTQGAFLDSTNLVNWTTKEIITGKSLYSLAGDGGQLLAFGIEGLILRSRPVPNTKQVEMASFTFAPDAGNVYQSVFLFAGEPDQKFSFDVTAPFTPAITWTNLAEFEITDSQGFLFHVENVATNSLPASRIYRTQLIP